MLLPVQILQSDRCKSVLYNRKPGNHRRGQTAPIPVRLRHFRTHPTGCHRSSGGPLEPVREQCARYQERRDALCGGLRSIGWDVRDSQGTMFAWARIPEGFSSSQQFVMELMDKTGVICTPGDASAAWARGMCARPGAAAGKDSGNDRGHRSKRHPETAVSNRKKEPAREQTLYLPRTGFF